MKTKRIVRSKEPLLKTRAEQSDVISTLRLPSPIGASAFSSSNSSLISSTSFVRVFFLSSLVFFSLHSLLILFYFSSFPSSSSHFSPLPQFSFFLSLDILHLVFYVSLSSLFHYVYTSFPPFSLNFLLRFLFSLFLSYFVPFIFAIFVLSTSLSSIFSTA